MRVALKSGSNKRITNRWKVKGVESMLCPGSRDIVESNKTEIVSSWQVKHSIAVVYHGAQQWMGHNYGSLALQLQNIRIPQASITYPTQSIYITKQWKATQ